MKLRKRWDRMAYRIMGERVACGLTQGDWERLASRIEKSLRRVNRRAYLEGWSDGHKDRKRGQRKGA